MAANGWAWDGDMARASRNPVADLISVPFQNNTNSGLGEPDRPQNLMNIQPVMPVRDVVPLVDPNKAPTGADLVVDMVVAGVKVITGIKNAAGTRTGHTLAFAELGFVRPTRRFRSAYAGGPDVSGRKLVVRVRF